MNIFGRPGVMPWGQPHSFLGQPMTVSPGPVGEYFDVPNGAFPVPWGPDCQDPAGCDDRGPGMGTPSRFDGVAPEEYARRSGLQGVGIPARPLGLFF